MTRLLLKLTRLFRRHTWRLCGSACRTKGMARCGKCGKYFEFVVEPGATITVEARGKLGCKGDQA